MSNDTDVVFNTEVILIQAPESHGDKHNKHLHLTLRLIRFILICSKSGHRAAVTDNYTGVWKGLI